MTETNEMFRTHAWKVGKDRINGDTVLRFEFNHDPPLMLIINQENALAIAAAIFKQYGRSA